jgi:transposase
MKQRCRSSIRDNAQHYVGRGISYDPRWEDFEAFLSDMGERPKGCSLDRADNDKGYSKANCRWATPTEQTRNRRIAKMFTYEGRTMPIAEWAKERGISYSVAYARIRSRGALEFPTHNCRGRRSVKTFTHEGRTLYISEWAKEYGISYNVAQMRIKRHGSLELQQ